LKYELKKRGEPLWCFCRENQKTLALICAATVLIAVLQAVSISLHNRCYIKGKHGSLTAVRMEDGEDFSSVPLRIEAEKDGVKTRLDVILSFDEGVTVEKAPQEDPEAALKSELKELVRQLEDSKAPVIKLPARLEDGTKLFWSGGKTSSIPAILLLLPLSAAALYQNSREKEKTKARQKKDGILQGLPGFNNQLLLLLNSGLIFNDAFERIASGYEKRTETYLGKVILEIRRQSQETGSSLTSLMSQYSKDLGIREFSRMAAIVADNQYKGVNLSDKLESESELLWNQRKKLAEERGRVAETKLAFPLAILLLVLILITAAPAILQM